MRTKLLLGAALVALAASGAALAGTGHGKAHGIRYSFLGTLTATPGGGGVSIVVAGGNRVALRAMLGRPVTQTFAYGAATEFLRWTKGIPTVVQSGDLAAGDWVRVNVRAPRGASLAEIERRAARIVGDHVTEPVPPSQPLYLFRGRLAAVGSGSVTVDVRGGNRHGLRLLVGHSPEQAFAVGGETIVLRWQGKVPTVISLSQLTVGDRITVRVRAPKGSTLEQVAAAPARHVGEHEPPNAP